MKDFREKTTEQHEMYNERKRYTEVQVAISKLNKTKEQKG